MQVLINENNTLEPLNGTLYQTFHWQKAFESLVYFPNSFLFYKLIHFFTKKVSLSSFFIKGCQADCKGCRSIVVYKNEIGPVSLKNSFHAY